MTEDTPMHNPLQTYCEECGMTPCAFLREDYQEDEAYDSQASFKPKVVHIGVVAYTIGLANKQYGGREEGGWWYDTFDPERVFYVRGGKARELITRLRLQRVCDRMNLSERRAPPYSMACTGYWVVRQGAVLEHEPKQRPYYE